MTDTPQPTAVAVAEARRDVHELLVTLPAWDADRVRDALARFEAAVRAVGMREAAAMLRRYCPTHGAEDTCLMDCHCAGADEIDRDARKIAPTAPTT